MREITIIYNQQSMTIAAESSLADLLADHCQQRNFAVMVNQQFLPKQQHPEYQLKDQDQVDIIVPMQGG
jgi:thiamine biosynthesis protein ThiS